MHLYEGPFSCLADAEIRDGTGIDKGRGVFKRYAGTKIAKGGGVFMFKIYDGTKITKGGGVFTMYHAP